jgi:acetylornithine deacetylase
MRTFTTVSFSLAVIGHASALSFNIPSFQDAITIPSFAQLKTLLTASTISSASSPLLQLHKNLIEIPSITQQEQDVAQWLANHLLEQNLTVETQVVGDPANHRTNILAYPGKTRQTKVLLTSHIDVVPPFIPYREAGGKIYGRGSADAKGSVAAQTTALLELLQKKEVSEGDASLLFVVGEETTADGMLTVNELGLEWEAVIFGEPTEGKLSKGHKGIILFHIEAHGKAAHSGYPELGKNANHMLVDALSRLLSLELPQDEVLGNSSINVGKFEGGVAGNVIPEKASADVVVRVASSDHEDVWEKILEAVKGDVPEITVTRGTPFYGGQVLDVDVEGKRMHCLSMFIYFENHITNSLP